MKHTGENLNKSEWEVREVLHSEAKLFIEKNHYSKGASNTSVYRHGLFKIGSDEILGACLWMPPTAKAAKAIYPENFSRLLTLSRLAIDPQVPRNGATFLLSRSVKFIVKEKKWEALVTYADEWQNHEGKIYAALGWEYQGKTKPSPVYVCEVTGKVRGKKSTRNNYSREQMESMGRKYVGSYCKHRYFKYLGWNGLDRECRGLV